MLHALMHFMGIDSQNTWQYMLWSGFGPFLVGIFMLLFGWWQLRIEIRGLRFEMQRFAEAIEGRDNGEVREGSCNCEEGRSVR